MIKVKNNRLIQFDVKPIPYRKTSALKLNFLFKMIYEIILKAGIKRIHTKNGLKKSFNLDNHTSNNNGNANMKHSIKGMIGNFFCFVVVWLIVPSHKN